MQRKASYLVAVLLLLLGTGSPLDSQAYSGCHDYSNSSATFFFGYGWACAGTGGTCRECYKTGTGGSYSVCAGEVGGKMICYDYQNW